MAIAEIPQKAGWLGRWSERLGSARLSTERRLPERRGTRADVPQAYVHDADLLRDHARAGLL
jgi:hypothetical protein